MMAGSPTKYHKRVGVIALVFGICLIAFGLYFSLIAMIDFIVSETPNSIHYFQTMPLISVIGALFLVFAKQSRRVAGSSGIQKFFGWLSVFTILTLIWFLLNSYQLGDLFPGRNEGETMFVSIMTMIGAITICLVPILLIAIQLRKSPAPGDWRLKSY